ncbi:hypothetical protein evm_013618 [Chilo suppressalis]|nr:hypothetical protein evm_013618 [Chilo suppressalis]
MLQRISRVLEVGGVGWRGYLRLSQKKQGQLHCLKVVVNSIKVDVVNASVLSQCRAGVHQVCQSRSDDMRPHDDIRNGDDRGAGSRPCSVSGSSEGGSVGSVGSGDEGEGGASGDEVSLVDEGAPARVLSALNALRKSRQHYDVLLVADGAEVPAHRAVLAAASPYLLEALQSEASHAVHRVEDVSGESLRALVEYAYTGRVRVRGAGAARRLYACAWRLRVDRVRAQLATRLLRQLAPATCLPLRALPDLAPDQLQAVDRYIAAHFEEICASGAMNGLPVVNISMLRDSSAEDGEETPPALADAALAWLRDRQRPDVTLEELCSRQHLVYVDARGELRDCGELPASSGEAAELGQYRRDAARRRTQPAPPAPAIPAMPGTLGAR